jgi:hypothetical protein
MTLKQLKKEIPYQWRVQSINDYAATCVAYIDSRDAQDLLDDVLGPENWQSDYKEVKGNVYAGVGIKIGNEWVWKWDCGTESKMEAEKGEASDAFKRACVKWGLGRFLYSLDIVKLKVTKYNGKNYPLNEQTGKAIFDKDELNNYIKLFSQNPPATTLHNHKQLGTTDKRLISNGQFKQLIERVQKGDFEAGYKAKDSFTFEANQKKIFVDAMQKIVPDFKF